MKTVTRLNLCSFLAAGRKARPREKAIKVDTKLVDAFLADVQATEAENAVLLAEKTNEIVKLERQLAELKLKMPVETPVAE